MDNKNFHSIKSLSSFSLHGRSLITEDRVLGQVHLPQSLSISLCLRLGGVRHSLPLADCRLSGHTIALKSSSWSSARYFARNYYLSDVISASARVLAKTFENTDQTDGGQTLVFLELQSLPVTYFV